MKRLVAWMMALMLLCGAVTTAHAAELIGQDGLYAVVNNPNPEDRLNLREKPSTSAASLGKYYNGTYVRVLGVDKNGWAHVTVGTETGMLEGYMKEEYLNRDPANIGAMIDLPQVYVVRELGSDLRSEPKETSPSIGALEGWTTLLVIGYTPNWYHVQYGGITAFVSAFDCHFMLGAPAPDSRRTLLSNKRFSVLGQEGVVSAKLNSYQMGDTIELTLSLPQNPKQSMTDQIASLYVWFDDNPEAYIWLNWDDGEDVGDYYVPNYWNDTLYYDGHVEVGSRLTLGYVRNYDETPTAFMNIDLK